MSAATKVSTPINTTGILPENTVCWTHTSWGDFTSPTVRRHIRGSNMRPREHSLSEKVEGGHELGMSVTPMTYVHGRACGTVRPEMLIADERGQGDVNEVREAYERGMDVNESDEEGFTRLHHAAIAGHFGIVEFLLEHGAEINAQTDTKYTALHYAVAEGHLNVVRILLGAGANLEVCMVGRRSALHVACEFGRSEILGELLGAGANVEAQDEDGATPLHCAAWEGHEECVHLLLKAGANPNSTDHENDTPLHNAVRNSPSTKTIRLLLHAGAIHNVRNSQGQRPIDIARRRANHDQVIALEQSLKRT